MNNTSPIGFLQAYTQGFNDYSQAGTDIPSLRMQDRYAQETGGPLLNQSLISATPSFDTMGPDIDSPEVDEWIKQLKSAPGYVDQPLDMDRIQRNINKLRGIVQPILKKA
jgi:hypothetical protein